MPSGRKHKPGKNHLLVIAIDAYEHCTPLRNCVKDAKDLIQVLTERYAFEAENVRLVPNEEATKEGIYKAFHEMAGRMKKEDNLLIYYSGHGYYWKWNKTGHIVPVNAQEDAVWEYLSNADLLDMIRSIQAYHILLVADCCFSGAIFDFKKDAGTVQLAENVEQSKSRWGLVAGKLEKVSDGFHGANSPFAKEVLRFLKNNNEEKFPVSELIRHVKIKVPKKNKQQPIGAPLFDPSDAEGEFVFYLRKNEEDLWQKAEKGKQIALYEDYLLHFPEGQYREQAEQRILELKEDAFWQTALETNTIDEYEDYIDDYPEGQYVEEARTRIEALRDEEEWQRATYFHTRSSYNDYLKSVRYFRYHTGQYVEEAQARRQKLRQKRNNRKKAKEKEPIPEPPHIITPPKLVEMVFVEGGTFQMGSNEHEREQPIHEVNVKDFWIGKYPVTFEQYDQFCEATQKEKPDDKVWGRGNRPVIKVNWQDALDFCNWLSEKEGEQYRLPSEAEWEYAAKGGQKSQGFKYAGSNKPDEVGWYEKNSNGKTHPVGEKQPNELGIYDMSGNVWEWCADVWHDNYKGAPKNENTWTEGGDQERRVIRGGSWLDYDFVCRVSDRLVRYADSRNFSSGFRISRY